MAYTPSPKILERYAAILVRYALGDGAGVQPGEVVWMRLHESAKPFYVPLRAAILKAGGHPLIQYIADDVREADTYTLASNAQLSYFPDIYYRGLVNQIDHMVYIISESDKYQLQDVDPKKIMMTRKALQPYMEWRNEKESRGEFTWTLAMYGTPAMALDAGMTEEEYWDQIIKACYLDSEDPIAEWKRTSVKLERIKARLNSLQIGTLRLESEGTDLIVGIGPHREWMGGGGRNIPSFEIFISPDTRLTEGTVRFNLPLFTGGNKIEGITLTFRNGRVVHSSATRGEEYLHEMIALEHADRIGEYSLTDRRFSRITRIMNETLFDENIGGSEGNTHLALGNAYQDSYPGDPSSVTAQQWNDWGYNRSSVHTDIISTEQRTVTATLEDGTTQVIYRNGEFTL